MKGIARLSRVLLAGTAALALAGPATVGMGENGLAFIQPAAAASVQIDFFYDRLAPHGSWVNHRRHGYVFVPAVGSGWRPYTRGHWVYTDAYGWYWESEEEFAWATYHYGRWGYDNAFGWYWVPGNVWGPAWVSWRHGGGNVGWAPIGPGDQDGYIYGTPEYYEPSVVEAWVFVPERRFVAVDVARYVTPVVEINLFLGKARERHHVNYRDGHGYNGFLPRERVTKIVNKEVNIYNITNVNSPDEIRRGDRNRGGRDRDGDRNARQIQAFRADVSDTKPRERPKRVVNSAEEIKSPPRLKQTAKGKRPEGAPPSVAELKKEDNVARPGAGDRERAEGRDRRPDDRDGKDRDNARRDGDRDGKRGQSENADRKKDAGEARSTDGKGDDQKPRQAGRKQDDEKAGKRGDGEQKARQGDDAQKARQADRKEDAGKDDAKPKAAARPDQPAREKAEPKPDSQKQRSREASPKQNEQPKGERRGEGQQKQNQAKPDRQPQQKQAQPDRQPQQKQAQPDRQPKQNQAKPEPKRQAPPQRESRNAPPQGQPEAKPQPKRQAPQQAAKQPKPNKPQQPGRQIGQGGGEQQERGGPNR
jgi:hypothetical protein